MSKTIKIKKGLDINLKGKLSENIVELGISETYAIRPDDVKNLTPKGFFKPGEKVKAGTAIFFDKYRPDIFFTSPVSGKLVEIKRGERRKILEFIVEADKEIEYKEFKQASADSLQKEEIVENLKQSGLWSKIIQRPYGVIANSEDTPKAIHISTFDSAPLAVNYNFTLKDEMDNFQEGVNILAKLTSGNVYLNLDNKIQNNIFANINNATITKFEGKHPAGNVGVQISKLTPINKGEIVWTVNPQDVVFIGRLFKTGKYDVSKIVALAGSEVETPQYYKLIAGANIKNLVKDNIKTENVRYISGNVLTGIKIAKDSYLGHYDNMLTVIPEGNHYDLFGWVLPGLNKFSVSRSFLSWLTPKKEYTLHTNTNGGQRAFVLTGEIDKVFPMDILPMQLLKAILANDIDAMEQLGIYEVIEEDFALCEFVDVSKIDMQDIVSEGIASMIKEMS